MDYERRMGNALALLFVFLLCMLLVWCAEPAEYAEAGEITAYWTAPADDCSDTVGSAAVYEVIFTQDTNVVRVVLGSDLTGGWCGTGSGLPRLMVDNRLTDSGLTATWYTTYDSNFIAPAVYGTAEQYTFTGLNNGTYHLLLRPIDEAWNYAPWAYREYTVDAIEPTPIIVTQ